MKFIVSILAIVMVSCMYTYAGNGQTMYVRGKVIDKLTLKPLAGVNISLNDNNLGIGTITNAKGEFRLWNLPEGASTIKISHAGYQASVIEVKNLKNTFEQIVVIHLNEKSKNSKEDTARRRLSSLKKRTIAKK